jgi:hypothetical protein
MQAAIAGPHKLVRYLDGDVRLLFDLARDPDERTDLVGIADAELAHMEALLDTWAAATGSPVAIP